MPKKNHAKTGAVAALFSDKLYPFDSGLATLEPDLEASGRILAMRSTISASAWT